MSDGEQDFQIRIGRLRDHGRAGQGRAKVFVVQVLQAAVRAGHRGARLGHRSVSARGQSGRGRGAAIAARLRSPSRRVVVQVRMVRHGARALRSAPLGAHIAYLKREGVDRQGGGGRLFDAAGEVEGRDFAARCEGDRHHFRIMISPEDASQMSDLRASTRELMAQAERDLGTRLEWAAVDHWNTDHPHVHILVRGRDDQGQDLVISRDYISRGLRARAEALVSLELGPRSSREIAADLQRQVTSERWTRLDQLLGALAVDGLVDLRPGKGAPDPDLRPLLIGRAERLEALGLAVSDGPGAWRIRDDAQARLQELGARGDIIKALHRAMGERRAMAELSPFGEQAHAPILGRLVERGLFDEQAGTAYAIVDGLDGRAHHVRTADLAATGDTPVGGIVEMRAQPGGARLVHRSDLPIEGQILATGATWLDRQLLARGPSPRSDSGFGAEAEAALRARAEHLESLGLARRTGRGWAFAADLLATLRRSELQKTADQLAAETGLQAVDGMGEPEVRGRYRRRLDLASGRFAMVEDGLGFRLVPWSNVLERQLGREVHGRIRDGAVDWEIGRRRELGR